MTRALVKKSVKKPLTKKESTGLNKTGMDEVFNANMDMEVILECPECKIQQVMTLEEYFTKIDYDYRDSYRKLLKCEMCKNHPELMFFKVDKFKILLAGINWERKQLGISEEPFAAMAGIYAKNVKVIKSKRKSKSLKA